MKKIILLKLGGSLITDKTKPYVLMGKNIKQIVHEVNTALEKDKTIRLIIGTGTGSFGHYPVQQFRIEKGSKTESQKYGFCSVHHSALKLNQIIVEELLKNTIKAFSLHPSSMMTAKNGVITDFYYEPIMQMIDMGIVPVVHGDMIYDKTLGSKICSVEQLFSELIIRLYKNESHKIVMIYAGSTDGVLDSNGKTIATITIKSIGRIQSPFFETKGYDVTGGMKTKVMDCLGMAQYGVDSFLINGSSKGNIEKILLGGRVRGTKIISEE
ncbi:isopentenyl phosphate kinase family protein [Candidatus Roizmanbacteria bacterium]|nr:isopentenyl phosphate kinase family protein [Candidatus Roizmanbacteria bacterium]